MQSVFGLGSYLPFLVGLIMVHLLTAHLLWRLMLRVGVDPWIATFSAGVFLVLGAGSENLLWAFQMAFVGAITCTLGALLLAMHPTLRAGRAVTVAVLLLVAVATSGTALPFLLPVALVLWRVHGWLRALLVTAPSVVAYLVWVVLIAAPNGNASLQAQGIDILLVPSFAGAMFVNGLGLVVPVPFIGILIVAVIGAVAFRAVGRRLNVGEFTALAVLGAGIAFALLTGFTRWGTGIVSASSGRYVYVIFVAVAPIAALIITRFARGSRARTAVALVLIAGVGVCNLRLLVGNARVEATREHFTQEVISAAIDLVDRYPAETQPDAQPQPVYLPGRTVSQLRTLHDEQGLALVSFGERAWLTAVVNVGLGFAPADEPSDCTPVTAGTAITASDVLRSGGGEAITVAATAVDGAVGEPRAIAVPSGPSRMVMAGGTPVVVTDASSAGELCIAPSSPEG
jgi:hypothetical protein